MAAAGIDDRCSRILLLAAAVVVTILGLLAAPASAREVPDELMKQQRVSTQHDVPSGPNPGSNLWSPLPPRDDVVAVEANGGHRYELMMKQQRVSTQHDVPSGPNPGSNLSPPLPGRDDVVVAVEANGGGHLYELMKQQRVSTQHDVPSGPNPGSNLSPLLPSPPHDIVADSPWRPLADGEEDRYLVITSGEVNAHGAWRSSKGCQSHDDRCSFYKI